MWLVAFTLLIIHWVQTQETPKQGGNLPTGPTPAPLLPPITDSNSDLALAIEKYAKKIIEDNKLADKLKPSDIVVDFYHPYIDPVTKVPYRKFIMSIPKGVVEKPLYFGLVDSQFDNSFGLVKYVRSQKVQNINNNLGITENEYVVDNSAATLKKTTAPSPASVLPVNPPEVSKPSSEPAVNNTSIAPSTPQPTVTAPSTPQPTVTAPNSPSNSSVAELTTPTAGSSSPVNETAKNTVTEKQQEEKILTSASQQTHTAFTQHKSEHTSIEHNQAQQAHIAGETSDTKKGSVPPIVTETKETQTSLPATANTQINPQVDSNTAVGINTSAGVATTNASPEHAQQPHTQPGFPVATAGSQTNPPPLPQAAPQIKSETLEKTLEKIEVAVQKNEKIISNIEHPNQQSANENQSAPIVLPPPVVLPTPVPVANTDSKATEKTNPPIILPPLAGQPTPMPPAPESNNELPITFSHSQADQINSTSQANINPSNVTSTSVVPNIPFDPKSAKVEKILDSLQAQLTKNEEKSSIIDHQSQTQNPLSATLPQQTDHPAPNFPNSLPLPIINNEKAKTESPAAQNQSVGLPINVIPPMMPVSQMPQNINASILNSPIPLPVFPGVEVQKSGSEGSAVPKITVDVAKVTEGLAKNPEIANIANQVINKFGSEVTKIVTTEIQKQAHPPQATAAKNDDDDFLKKLFAKYAQGENYDEYLSSDKKATETKGTEAVNANQPTQTPAVPATTPIAPPSSAPTANNPLLPSGTENPLQPLPNDKTGQPTVDQTAANGGATGANPGRLPIIPNIAELAKSFMANMQQSGGNKNGTQLIPDLPGLPKLDSTQNLPESSMASGKDTPTDNPFANLALFSKDGKLNLPIDLSKISNQKIDLNEFLKNLPDNQKMKVPIRQPPLDQNNAPQGESILTAFNSTESQGNATTNATMEQVAKATQNATKAEASITASGNETSANVAGSSTSQNATLNKTLEPPANQTSTKEDKEGEKPNKINLDLSKIQEEIKQLIKVEEGVEKHLSNTQTKTSANNTVADVINEFKKVVEEKIGANTSKQSTTKPGVIPSGPTMTEIIEQMKKEAITLSTQKKANTGSGTKPAGSADSTTKVTVPPGISVIKSQVVAPKIGTVARFSGQRIRAQLYAPQNLDLMKSMARSDTKFANQVASIVNDQIDKQISIPEKVGNTIETKVLPVNRSDNEFGLIRIVGFSDFVNQKGIKENPMIQQAIQNKQYNLLLNSVEY